MAFKIKTCDTFVCIKFDSSLAKTYILWLIIQGNNKPQTYFASQHTDKDKAILVVTVGNNTLVLIPCYAIVLSS